MAFDVSIDRAYYAYGLASTIYLYSYTNPSSTAAIANASLVPNNNLTISDIRFSPSNSSSSSSPIIIFATVRQSDAIYRCNLSSVPQCMQWMAPVLTAPESGRSFQGGCQVFAPNYERIICALGTYRTPALQKTASVIWSVSTRNDVALALNLRNPIYTFPANDATVSFEILGPPAYNQGTATLYVFVAASNATNSPFQIWRFYLDPNSMVLVQNASSPFVVYSHSQAVGLARSAIVGASLRRDTNTLVAIDENFRRLYIFASRTPSSIAYSTNLTAANNYKDLEFVGGGASSASKMFMTSLENGTMFRAELYVQCAPCKANGITRVDVPAESQADCFCPPGYFTAQDGQGCTSCSCGPGTHTHVLSSRFRLLIDVNMNFYRYTVPETM
jgi:hypothetical protein